MGRHRVETADLRMGMYVAELDCPWVDSPFLFQGFRIESVQQMETLRRHCRYVLVEDAQAEDDADGGDRTIRRSMNVRPDANPERSRAEWNRIASEERRVTFRREFERVSAIRVRTREYVNRLLTDVRFGRAVNTTAAKTLVSETVDAVTANPDTALWLTQLKHMHDYTAQHCINVAVLSIAFGAHLGYSKEQLRIIGLGALLHDIGKMRTPPHILDKPGRLTAEEFALMKRHPVDGYEIMKATNEIPAQALQIIRYHHERISGRGYPDGLCGEQISTAVMVVAICDVYDAITSDRIYHHGVPPDQGLHTMYQIAPADFGRELVQEFIRCIGIYPVGSLVELGNGAVGVVMTKDPQNKLRPVVMLLRDGQGREYRQRRFVSLAAQASLNPRQDWSVRRIVDPRERGIDLGRIAGDELLAGGYRVVHI